MNGASPPPLIPSSFFTCLWEGKGFRREIKRGALSHQPHPIPCLISTMQGLRRPRKRSKGGFRFLPSRACVACLMFRLSTLVQRQVGASAASRATSLYARAAFSTSSASSSLSSLLSAKPSKASSSSSSIAAAQSQAQVPTMVRNFALALLSCSPCRLYCVLAPEDTRKNAAEWRMVQPRCFRHFDRN